MCFNDLEFLDKIQELIIHEKSFVLHMYGDCQNFQHNMSHYVFFVSDDLIYLSQFLL